MNISNMAGLGIVIAAGAAFGWLAVGEEKAVETPAEVAAGTKAPSKAPAGNAATWAAERPTGQRSTASDGGPDEGLPPPPPGIDVAEDSMRRAQRMQVTQDSPLQTGGATSAAPPSVSATPSARPIPEGAGWTPSPDAGWGPPADRR